MLELLQFAAFMVGDHCDFKKAPFFQDLFDGATTCFSVSSTVSFGVAYLCIGVALYNFVVFTGLRLAHIALEERMSREVIALDGQSHRETIISKLVRYRSLSFLVERLTYE